MYDEPQKLVQKQNQARLSRSEAPGHAVVPGTASRPHYSAKEMVCDCDQS